MKRLLPTLLACVFCFLLTGCADGTLPELNGMNPFQQQQWAQDLQFGPTFHEQVAELEQIRENGPNLPPDEQQYRVRQLTELIRTQESVVMRVKCVQALAAIPLPQAQEGLDMASADQEIDVRVAACGAWRTRGGPEAIQALTAMLKSDTEIDVRIAAARALGGFQEPAAVQALATALDDRDPALQMRVMDSLGSATGRNYGTDITAWRTFLAGGNPPSAPPSIADRLRSGRLF